MARRPLGRKPKQCSKCHRHARNDSGWSVYRKDGVLTCTVCDPLPKPEVVAVATAPKRKRKKPKPKPQPSIPFRKQAQMLYERGEKQKLADLYRANLTKSEELLRGRLKFEAKTWNLKFKTQAVLHGYIADFFFRTRNLVVELDGHYHYTEERRDWDAKRDAALLRHGIRTLRIASRRVFCDINGVIEEIRKAAGVDRRKAA